MRSSFSQLFAHATARASSDQGGIYSEADEDNMPIEAVIGAWAEVYGPAMRNVVDTYAALAEGEEKMCTVNLRKKTQLVVKITCAQDEQLSIEGSSGKLSVLLCKNKHSPVVRCELRIDGVHVPEGWQGKKLNATALFVSEEQDAGAFYVMNKLSASKEPMCVPDTRSHEDNEIEGPCGKTDRVCFGAGQQAALITAEDDESSTHALLSLISAGDPTTASISLQTFAACQVGLFAVNDPCEILDILGKRGLAPPRKEISKHQRRAY